MLLSRRAAVGAGLAAACWAVSARANDLDRFRWRRRLLLLGAPTEGNGAFNEQLGVIRAAADGFLERDMTVIALIGGRVVRLLGAGDPIAQEGRPPAVRPASIRTVIGSVDQFSATLVGKDGDVKRRWTAPVSANALFAVIDAMPMRRGEMRE